MSGLVSRAVTTCGLMALLATCVRFEAYTVLYIAFSMPGIAEFVTMSLHGGGAEAAAAAEAGAGGTGGAGGSAAPRRVVSAAITAAYVYNSALALAMIEFDGRGDAAVEAMCWNRFVRYTVGLTAAQLGIFACSVLWSPPPTPQSAKSTSNRLPETMQLFIIYIGALWGPGCTFFAPLLAARHGIAHLVFLIVATQLQDNWQLVFGKLFGRHRPFPYLSPKKSVKGYVGGTIATVAQIWYFGAWFGHRDWKVTSFFVVVFGIAGDLSMSALKRWRKIKDTGSILPGVGGLLDRTDSLLLVLPVVYAWETISTGS
jgi:CDP-diglyceride synthetase